MQKHSVVEKQNVLFFSLWDTELGEGIASGLQDTSADGLGKNKEFVTDLI